MQESHARGANRMGLHAGNGRERGDLHAEVGGSAVEVGAADVSNKERAAVELLARAFKWLFGCVHGRVAHLVTQGRKGGLRVVVDGKRGSLALDASGRADFRHGIHGHIQDFCVRHPRHLHVKEFAEGPAGVVIRSFLRIVRAPVLVVQQSVGNAGVGLIHANDVTAYGEFACRGGGRLRFLLLVFFAFGGFFGLFRRERHGESRPRA